MAYEDPDKFISDSTLFFLPGAMILWLLIFMIVTLSYSVNSPPKIMPRAVSLGLVGVASVFMGLWLLGLMVCYCRGTFLKGRSGRDVALKPPGWGEDMERRMCALEKQTKPPTPLPGQAHRNHQNDQIKRRDEQLLSQTQAFQGQPMPQPVHPQSVHPQSYKINLCNNPKHSKHSSRIFNSKPNDRSIKTVYDAIDQSQSLKDRGSCPRHTANLATATRLPAVRIDPHLTRVVTIPVSKAPRL
ncbi:hypothetical protein CKAH01_03558 [Colletotrichum kahawae]|uniref:Uncharacterized protein n=1 Tax=Colletotrichum kahawae TaxID=34407 RepID=A0AAD9YQJ0_COLKA|nr:hypothetical protein CKAH01_03558 [Colletotrichum kahawae]